MINKFNDVEKMIGQPEGERLEYKAILPSSSILAKLICSFANTEGGFIVLGVSENMEIIGLSKDFRSDPITQKAISLLSPKPTVFSKYITFKNKPLYIIAIEKSSQTIRLDGRKYVREGVVSKLSDSVELKFDPKGFFYEEKVQNTQGVDYHEYDINLSESFKELEEQLKNIEQTKGGLTKNEYLSRIKGGIESYSKFHNLGSLNSSWPIIVKYPAYNYHAHLAFELMTFDVLKIPYLLDHHHENFTGLDTFQKIVEHGVYNWVKQNSPFDNQARLQKIIEWVEKSKGIEHEKNKIAKAIGKKILDKFKKQNAETGDIVMLESIQSIYNEADPSEQKLFNDVFRGMNFDGFISYDDGEPNYIVLDEKGYKIVKENVEPVSNSISRKIKKLPTVVILTAIGEEYLAVRDHLVNRKVWKKDAIIFEQGVFIYKGVEVAQVFVRECGAKNVKSALETQRALTYHKPDCILFVGIAGSKKPHDFGLGDVIFAEKIHYYEGGKSELAGFKPRSDDVKPTLALFEIAKLERHNPEWKSLIKSPRDKEVKVNLGVIASGEQVVEHFDSEIGKLLSMYYGDSACVEMEGYGFLHAIESQGGEFAVDFAGVIRGVSDILKQNNDGPGRDEEDRRPAEAKKIASENAAAFAYWLIIKVFE